MMQKWFGSGHRPGSAASLVGGVYTTALSSTLVPGIRENP